LFPPIFLLAAFTYYIQGYVDLRIAGHERRGEEGGGKGGGGKKKRNLSYQSPPHKLQINKKVRG